MVRRKSIIAGILCSMLVLGGCGKAPEEISDYGNGIDDHVVENSIGGIDSTQADTETEADTSITTGTSNLANNELFGNKQIQWRDNFTVDDDKMKADVYIDYYPIPAEKLPLYKYRQVKLEDIHEDEIVEKIFGGTAEKRTSDLSIENGDSGELVMNYSGFLYSCVNRMDPNQTYSGWVDGEDYFIHTYEGQYKGVDAQMIIGYSYITGSVFLTMCPKVPGELIDNPNYKGMGTYQDMSEAEWAMTGDEKNDYDLYLDGLANKCQKTPDELVEDVSDFVGETFGIKPCEAAFQTRDEGYMVAVDGEVVVNDESTPRTEVVFYNIDDELLLSSHDGENKYDTEGLMIQEKNGYYVSLCNNISGFGSFGKASDSYKNYEYYELAAFNQGGFYVNDYGVLGFCMIFDSLLTEEVADSANVLSFENLKNAFVTAVSENVDSSQVDTDALHFKNMNVVYYGVADPDNASEGTMVPALWVHAVDGTRDTLEVIINALDGSLIEIKY